MLSNQLKGIQAKLHIPKNRMTNSTITSDHVKSNNTSRPLNSQLYTSELPQEETLMENVLILWISHALWWNSDFISLESLRAKMDFLNSFKAFSVLLSPQLCVALPYLKESAKVPSSFYEACMTVVLKVKIPSNAHLTGRSPHSLPRFWPVLVHRLEIVLPSIASGTSFIKNQCLSSVWYIIFSSHGDSRLSAPWIQRRRLVVWSASIYSQVWTQIEFLDKIATSLP